MTGSHSAKFGFRYADNDSTFPKNYYNNTQLQYTFTTGVPTSLTMYADQGSQQEQKQTTFAMFAQDRWTLGRLSLQGGLRFEHLGDYFPQQQMGPNVFLPTAVVFPAQNGPLNQKDIQPRFGASYDLLGNGKTAAKFFVGRYVTTTNTVNEWLFYSPAGAGQYISSTTRPWTDANGNYVPDCNLLNPAGNGECGPMANPFFGKAQNNLTVDPSTTNGWNKREYSWDLSAGVTQQLGPRVSAEVDYIHRSWGNLLYTVNRDLTPASFDPFVYNVPSDPRLPGGGGYPLTFYDVKPSAVGNYDNYQTFADNLGGAYNVFHGVDFTVNARLHDLTFKGGTSSGNVIEDDCGVATQHPDIYISAYGWGGSLNAFSQFFPTFVPAQWPQSFCHRESGWQTNIKGLVTYNVPKIDALLAATFHSVPYPGNNFPAVASQSNGAEVLVVPGQTTLGRPFSSGQPIEFLSIVQPGALYGARLNGVDLRIAKNLRFGRTRTMVAVDIFNSSTRIRRTCTSRPTGRRISIRCRSRWRGSFKISAQFDF